MNPRKPDLLILLSLIFVIGAAVTSLSANSETHHPEQLSQYIIR